MSSFKPHDKVFCPVLSNKPYKLYTSDNRTLYLLHNDKKYTFNTAGFLLKMTYFGDVVVGDFPTLLVANEKNRAILSDVYVDDFVLDIDIKIYALRMHYEGTYAWSTVGLNGLDHCEIPPSNVDLIQYLRDNSAIVGTNRDAIRCIPQGHNFSVVCVGKDSINNWTNEVDENDY